MVIFVCKMAKMSRTSSEKHSRIVRNCRKMRCLQLEMQLFCHVTQRFLGKKAPEEKKARGSAFERFPVSASNCHSPMSER